MRNTASASVMIGALALFATACTNPQEVSEIKAKVDEVQAQQKDLLTKIDALAKGQKEILAKASAPAPAAAPGRPAEDPNKVYTIPEGNSFVKGPKDAAVTIVEFSDFQ